MLVETKITWDKVVLEIQNLSNEGCESVAPLMIATDHLISATPNSDQTFRRLHFLCFELASLCEQLSEKERLEHLIEFFFDKKAFVMNPDVSVKNLSLREALTQFHFHPVVGLSLFLHMAHELHIPLFWVKFHNRYILKWVRSGKSDYFDFSNPKYFLNESEILKIFETTECSVECWGSKDTYQLYLSLLVKALENENQTHSLHTAYSLSIQADQNNTHLLGRRAFLRHKMGFAKEAHADLKRYFSFVEKDQAPVEIQDLYQKVSMNLDQSLDVPSGPGPVYH